MKLEVGKKYELNNGEVWECKLKTQDGKYLLGGYLYKVNGMFHAGICEELNVKRCVDDPKEVGVMAPIKITSGPWPETIYGSIKMVDRQVDISSFKEDMGVW